MTEYDEVFLVGGRPLLVHRREYCEGRNCSIHNPSDHPLKDAPHVWRSDRGLMERECEHGIGHPDPDDLDFKRRIGHRDAQVLGIHGCDGCCRSDPKPVQVEFLKRKIPKKPFLLPIVLWLDSGWGSLVRQAMGFLAIVELALLLFRASGFGPANFILTLFSAAFYCGSTSLIYSYKHHHPQYFRRSTQ